MTEQQPEQNDVHSTADAADDQEQGEQLVLTSPEDAQTPKELGLWAGVILLAALTVYSPALRGDFLWDDDRHVSANRNLHDFDGLVRIWTRLGLPAGGTVQYYPLTHTTFWLEYQLTGQRPGQINTLVFHVSNVVLHVISAILLWLVLRELKVPGAWVAASIWALHPVQVESVAWISERKNVLSGVFFFGAILAYLRSGFGLYRREDPVDEAARGPAHPGLYWLALGLFVCALLSKTVTVSMPAVVLLLIWWKRGRLTARDFAATAPLFIIGIGMAALTAWMERTQVGARGPEWDAITFPQRVLIAGRAIWFYVEKNLLPLNLSFIYRRWDIANAPPAWWLFPAAVVAVAAALFALRNRIGRGPLVAFLIFCGVLAPALGFVSYYPMRYSFVADHFQYLAGPALIALIVAGVTILMRRVAAQATAAPYVLAAIVLVVLSALTLMQARVYAGPLLLWHDAIQKNPTSPMLRHNYAMDLLALTEQLPPREAIPFVEEATRQFEAAVKLDPEHDRAWANWGRALIFLNRPHQGLQKYDQALKLRPDSIAAMMGRGRALYDLKRYDEARAAYMEALTAAQAQRGTPTAISRPSAAVIYQYLGKIAVAQNELEEAARHYAEAVDLMGDLPSIRYEYGMLLARQAKQAQAAATQAAATQVAVSTTTTTQAATRPTTTATTLASATQPTEQTKKLLGAAAVQLAAAIELRPDHIDARVALANLMMDVGNLPGAQTQLAAAVRSLSALNEAAYAPLQAAVTRWDAEMKKREAATTGPATTRAATAPSP